MATVSDSVFVWHIIDSECFGAATFGSAAAVAFAEIEELNERTHRMPPNHYRANIILLYTFYVLSIFED